MNRTWELVMKNYRTCEEIKNLSVVYDSKQLINFHIFCYRAIGSHLLIAVRIFAMSFFYIIFFFFLQLIKPSSFDRRAQRSSVSLWYEKPSVKNSSKESSICLNLVEAVSGNIFFTCSCRDSENLVVLFTWWWS